MGAAGEEVKGLRLLQMVAVGLEQRHIPGKRSGVAGDIDQRAGGKAGDGLDGVGIQPLAGRIHHDHIRMDALTLQLQRSRSGVGTEEFGIFDAVAPGVVFGVLHRLGNDLDADDLARMAAHGQGDGTHAAVEIQHRILTGDAGGLNGGAVKLLRLMVVDLVEGSGGQPEGQPAQGILDIAGAVEGDEFISQHGVAGLGVHAEYQGGEAVDLLKPLDQRLRAGELAAVGDDTHEDLPGDSPPADIDMADDALAGGFVIGIDPILVHIVDHGGFHKIRLLRQDQTALILHHLMGARTVEPGEGLVLLGGYGILGLVAVAGGIRGGVDLDGVQCFAPQPVQTGAHSLCFQAALLFIVHVLKIAPAAQLGNGADPVDPVGGTLQDLDDLAACPCLSRFLNADLAELPGDGIGHEDGAPLNFGNTLPLGGIVHDAGGVNLIFN